MTGFQVMRLLAVLTVAVFVVSVVVMIRQPRDNLDMRPAWTWVLVAVSGFFCVFAVGLLAATEADRIACRNTAQILGLEWEFHVSTACLVEYESQWIPLDQLLRTIGDGSTPD